MKSLVTFQRKSFRKEYTVYNSFRFHFTWCLSLFIVLVFVVCTEGFLLQNSNSMMLKKLTPTDTRFFYTYSTSGLKQGRKESKKTRKSSNSPLYMIDNFFRLHETKRELDSQYEDLFAKNKYDEPHAFGSSVIPFQSTDNKNADQNQDENIDKDEVINDGNSFKLSLEEALTSAMNQLPACGKIDFIIAMIQEKEITTRKAEIKLKIMKEVLPDNTPIIGWMGEIGMLLGGRAFGDETNVLMEQSGISIIVGSLPGVKITPFALGEENLKTISKENDDSLSKSLWSSLFQIDALDGKSDPPCFYLLGKTEKSSTTYVDKTIESLQENYPGCSMFGSLANPTSKIYPFISNPDGGNLSLIADSNHQPDSISGSKESSGDQDVNIIQPGHERIMGLCLHGDIRTMIFSSLPEENEDQSENITIIPKNENVVHDSAAEECNKEDKLFIKNIHSIPSDMNQNNYDLYIQLNQKLTELPEGPDRWSGTAVRGNSLTRILIPKDEWKLNYMYDKVSLELQSSLLNLLQVPSENHLIFSKTKSEDFAGKNTVSSYSKVLDLFRAEIIKEYNAEELGTSRFRPSGAMIISGSESTEDFASENKEKLRSLFRMTNLSGLANTWKQIAPLSPGITSAVVSKNIMTIAFSCSARRKDVRNFRFSHNEPLRRIPAELPNNSNLDNNKNTANFKNNFKDAFENFYSPAKLDENGDVVIERKASLGGSDVRVDTMAWGLKQDSAPPSSVLELMVWNKEREMEYLREDAPLLNLVKTVMLQSKQPDKKPIDIFELIQSSFVFATNWFEFGRIRRGSPTSGLLINPYLPAEITSEWKSTRKSHFPGVVVDVDQTFYGGSYQHLRDLRELPDIRDVPVVSDDIVLYPYQLYLARLFGADGITIRPHLTTSEDLTYMLKIAKSLSMTPFLVVSSVTQLERCLKLLIPGNHVIIVLEDTQYENMGTILISDTIDHPAQKWLQEYDICSRYEELGLRREDIILLVDGKKDINEKNRTELQALGVRGNIASEITMLKVAKEASKHRVKFIEKDEPNLGNDNSSEEDTFNQDQDSTKVDQENPPRTGDNLGSFNLGSLGGQSINIF